MEEEKKDSKFSNILHDKNAGLQAHFMTQDCNKSFSLDPLAQEKHSLLIETFNYCKKIYELASQNNSIISELS